MNIKLYNNAEIKFELTCRDLYDNEEKKYLFPIKFINKFGKFNNINRKWKKKSSGIIKKKYYLKGSPWHRDIRYNPEIVTDEENIIAINDITKTFSECQ